MFKFIYYYCLLPSVFFLGVLICVFLGDETGVLFLGFLVEEMIGERDLSFVVIERCVVTVVSVVWICLEVMIESRRN